MIQRNQTQQLPYYLQPMYESGIYQSEFYDIPLYCLQTKSFELFDDITTSVRVQSSNNHNKELHLDITHHSMGTESVLEFLRKLEKSKVERDKYNYSDKEVKLLKAQLFIFQPNVFSNHEKKEYCFYIWKHTGMRKKRYGKLLKIDADSAKGDTIGIKIAALYAKINQELLS